ncbi:MAG: hypothetical protein WAN75_29165 [Xanthobacteraceae bacterium]
MVTRGSPSLGAKTRLTRRSKNRIEHHGRRYGTASTIFRRKLTIRVAINRNAEVFHDAANLAKCCAMVNPTLGLPRCPGYGQKPNVGAKSHGQKASAQTTSMEQRS